MKNKTMPILLFIGVVVLSVLSSLGCYYYLGDQKLPEQKDTTIVAPADTAELATLDTDMLSIENVVNYRRQIFKEDYYDSVFFVIPEPVLIDVCKVIIGRQCKLTMANIVEEFLRNNDSIYKHIAEPDIEPLPLEPDVRLRAGDTLKIPDFLTKDTMIDGIHIQLIANPRTVE